MTQMKQFKFMKFTKTLVVLLAVLTIVGCRKDIDGVPTEEIIQPAPLFFQETALTGQVVDENGNPIENARIQFSSFIETSDENGFFKFNSIDINEDGFLTTYEKEGYFNGYKFVFPSKSNKSFIKLMMVEKGDAENFNASTGGIIETNGASINFKANTVVIENSTQFYDGNVQAYFHWYDPSSTNTPMSMPGDLRGVSIENQFVSLTSYGMVAVELFGSNGEKLNLAPNTTATLTMQAPEGETPGVMPTWSMNEESGFWIEEGEAALINGNYVAELSHFSFWNCDVPSNLIFIDGIIQSSEGVPISNALIKINIAGSIISGSGYTNGSGEFSGYVPKDRLLEISVYDECGSLLYTGPLGEFSEDTSLPPIFANLTGDLITIEGRVLCDGLPVTTGYIKLDYGEENSTLVEINNDGSFLTSRLLCSFDASIVSLYAINTDLGTTSDEIIIDSISTTSINVGTIDACTIQADEWLSLTIDGTSLGSVYEVQATSDQEGLKFSASGIDGGVNFWLFDAGLGDNQPIAVGMENVWNFDIFCEGTTCNNLNVNFTNFDRFVDGYIQGTFEGELSSVNGETVTVEGDFRIQFDQYIPVAKIGGFAWDDSNMNGLFDNGESKTNVTGIYVTNNNYALILEQDGSFFGYVEADVDFTLQYLIDINESITVLDFGNDESVDNDFNADGFTETFQFAEGEEYLDFGLGLIENTQLECTTIPQGNFVYSCNPVNLSIEAENGSGNYSFLWSNGETTQTITVIDEGIYAVTVTDSAGTSCEADFTVLTDVEIFVETFVNNPTCGLNNGTIQVLNENELQSVYWFELNQDAFVLTDLAAGDYNYEAVDLDGCSSSGTITLVDQSSIIGNQVFVDAPGGIQNQLDTGDGPLEGVIVNLKDAATNEFVETMVTDDSGIYLFTGEYSGTFIMEFIIPDGYEFVDQINEIDDPSNSDVTPDDVNPLIGRTMEFEIECGEVILYIDVGVRI